jgi:copper chaperone CopZ
MKSQTDTRLRLRGVHLCCQACAAAVDQAVQTVAGAESQCDLQNQIVTVTAPDDAAAQQALDAIAAAGLYGRSDSEQFEIRPVGRIPTGKVHRLRVSGIHNCCDLCCDAIREAIATVPGVTGDTATAGATSFEVTGDFTAGALVRAINSAGFSARVQV